MTAKNPKAVYACVNLGEAWAPREIADRSICIDGDIGEVCGKNLRMWAFGTLVWDSGKRRKIILSENGVQ